MPNIYLITGADVERLKQLARRLKRSENIPHHSALDLAAKTIQAPNWHHVVEAYKATDAVDQALVGGLVIAFDAKDADDFRASDAGFLADDARIAERVFPDMLDYQRFGVDDDGVPAHERYSEEEIREFTEDDMWSYRFFRYVGDALPDTIEQVMLHVSKACFFGPRLVWYKGAMYDTCDQVVADSEGNAVGVRWGG